jgi:hypothetical protein
MGRNITPTSYGGRRWKLIMYIRDNPNSTIEEIAEGMKATYASVSSVSGTLWKLYLDGYLNRTWEKPYRYSTIAPR